MVRRHATKVHKPALLTAVAILLSAAHGHAQPFFGGAPLPESEEDAAQQAKSISSEDIPIDSSQIFEELKNWRNRQEVNRAWPSRLERDEREFGEKEAKARSNIDSKEKLNCDSPEGQKRALSWIRGVRDVIDSDYSLEGRKVQESLGAVEGGFPTAKGESAYCNRVVAAKGDIAAAVTAYFDARHQQLAKQKTRLAYLKPIDAAIADRIKRLNQEMDTAKSQKSQRASKITDDLRWIVAFLGAVSILAMLSIRLFGVEVQKEWVSSGQVIQFTTVMVLLMVILSLGLAGIIQDNTLGTLLGGIGGYVLSQGVGRAAARVAAQQVAASSARHQPGAPTTEGPKETPSTLMPG